MHVVVVTVAHRGDDARIVHRQARALLEAGHSVVLVAPDPGPEPRRFDPVGLEREPIRRAVGRRRIHAWYELSRLLGRVCRSADLVIFHDPELIPLLSFRRLGGAIRVWDVHEDYRALVSDTSWIPPMLTSPVRGALGILNSIARRRCKILIAEASYVTSFPQSVLVPNTTRVDSVFTSVTQPLRVVYVGRVSFDRGLREMIELGERLVQRGGPEVVIAGPSDDDCRAVLLDAVARGAVRWCGPIPNPEVFDVIRGSVAGLALLHDVANYRFSNPTKVWEYWSVGVPVIGTPLPSMTKMVSEAGGGVVLTVFSGPGVVEEAERAIDELSSRPERRDALGRSGWSLAGSTSDWARDGLDFVRELERLASESSTSRSRIEK